MKKKLLLVLGLTRRAAETKSLGGRINRAEAMAVLSYVNAPIYFTHRWQYDAPLTPFEMRLVQSEGGPL
jgi:hypothetical protein